MREAVHQRIDRLVGHRFAQMAATIEDQRARIAPESIEESLQELRLADSRWAAEVHHHGTLWHAAVDHAFEMCDLRLAPHEVLARGTADRDARQLDVQCGQQIRRAGTSGGIWVEQPDHRAVEGRRYPRRQPRRPLRNPAALVLENVGQRSRERETSREGLVQHGTYGVPIGRRRRRESPGLLWGHVVEGPRHGSLHRLLRPQRIRPDDETEVEQDHSPRRLDENVARLDVPVDLAGCMQHRDPEDELFESLSEPWMSGFRHRRCARRAIAASNELQKVDPMDQLHGVETVVVRYLQVVEDDQVWVRDVTKLSKLALES